MIESGPGEIFITIGDKCKYTVSINKHAFIKQGNIEEEKIDDYDCHFVNIKGKGFISSNCAYVRIQPPFNSNYVKCYINPNHSENEFLIGKTVCQLTLTEDGFDIIASRRDNHYKVRGYSRSRDNLVLLSRSSDLFGRQEMFDDKMSTNHCYCGYDTEKNLLFLIDYGSNGEGSTNGTYIKIKSHDMVEIQKEKNNFRFLRPSTIDYQVEVSMSGKTVKDP